MLRENSKAQMSAPFELVIAIIIMMFVLSIGYFAMQQTHQQVCKEKITKKLVDFKMALERALTRKEPVSIFFDLPNECYADELEEIKIVEKDDVHICEAYCGVSQPRCMLLQYTAKKSIEGSEATFGKTLCLNIPTFTTFPSSAGVCLDRSEDGYILVDLSYEVKQGFYELINVTKTGDVPTICAYLRTRR
ncbi:MAG: hypothetical protein J7L14_03955 [Candidatus Diapherotrites archaeon]|nr:hypothetical protein [Candidatus Diapherotrites archaeon]